MGWLPIQRQTSCPRAARPGLASTRGELLAELGTQGCKDLELSHTSSSVQEIPANLPRPEQQKKQGRRTRAKARTRKKMSMMRKKKRPKPNRSLSRMANPTDQAVIATSLPATRVIPTLKSSQQCR